MPKKLIVKELPASTPVLIEASEGMTSSWWDFEEKEVCFAFWRDGERKQISYDFRWYFFLSRPSFDKINSRNFDLMIDNYEVGKKFVKVYTDYYNRDKRKGIIEFLESKGVDPLEADVSPIDRFMFDNDIKISLNQRVLYYDIETDVGSGWDDLSQHRIISIAYGHSKEDLKCLTVETPDDAGEQKLLREFAGELGSNDVIVGWNSSAYDEIVVKERFKLHKLFPNWKMIHFLDQMNLFKKYYLRDESGSGVRLSYSLENIAKTVLGRGKVEDVEPHKMLELYRTNKKKLIEYNKRDVEIMMELEEKLGYIDAHKVLSQICNRFLSDQALMSSHLVDGFVLKYASQRGDVHFKTKHSRGEDWEEAEQIEGAFVMEPVIGLHYGVCDLDFSSLYPSIVISFNISPETRVTEKGDNCCTASNNAIFKKDITGIFAEVSKIALKARQEHKDKARDLEKDGKEGTVEHRRAKQRSDAWKVLANSLYGMISGQHSRYYDPSCGEAITVTGKTIIQRVIALAQSKSLQVVASDTDSCFIKCTKEIANEFARIAEKDVDDYLISCGANSGNIKLKLDAEFERIFFTAKKRYAGKKTTGKWDVRGLELVRSDGCKSSRELQRKIITFILESQNPNPSVAAKIVERWADTLFDGEAKVEDLVMSQSISRPIADYKVKPVHVAVAEELLRNGQEIYVGMKVPYILTGKKDGKLVAKHVKMFDGKYDADLYWVNKIYPASQRILESVFPKEDRMWKGFLKFENKNAPQLNFFTKKVATKSSVTFQLAESDREKLQPMREVIDRFPGERTLKLEISVPGSTVVLLSDVHVRLVPDLVKELEEIVGRRIFFGEESWDNA